MLWALKEGFGEGPQGAEGEAMGFLEGKAAGGPSAPRLARRAAAGAAALCLWVGLSAGTVCAFGATGQAAMGEDASASAAASGVPADGIRGGGASDAEGASAQPPEENAACTACHVNEAEAAQDEKTLSSLHADVLCMTCHDDEETLDELHAKTKAKRMPLRLKKTSVEDETCLACHEEQPGTDEFLALSEGNPLVDANGLEVNAHEMVGREGHEGIGCVSCHEVHDEADPQARAQKVCQSCHHADVYECFTCHEHA